MCSGGCDKFIGEKTEMYEKLQQKSNSMVLVNPLKGKTPHWDCKGIAGGVFTFSYI